MLVATKMVMVSVDAHHVKISVIDYLYERYCKNIFSDFIINLL